MLDAPPEPDVLAIGRDLAAALPGSSRHPLKVLDDRAMDLASQDAELRAALFRFVDVVPACRDLDDLARHLTGFLDEVPDRPPPLQVAMRMGATKAGRSALGAASAAGVKHMAHRFIVGETPKDATGVLEGLWKDGVGTSVDLLGEATVTAAEADRYAARCHEALDGLHEVYRRLPARPRLEADSFGEIPRENLSVKVSALTPLLRPDAPERGKRDAAPRLRDAPAPRPRGRRAPPHRHGVASTRARRSPTSCSNCSPRTSSATARRPGSCSRPTCATRPTSPTGSSRGRAPPGARTRSSSGSSRAPTGTTRSSRRASTAGSRPSSRSRPSPTATSRR